MACVFDVLSYFSLSIGVCLLSLSKAFYLLRAAMVSDPPGSQLSEFSPGYADLGLGYRAQTPSLISSITNKLTNGLVSGWTSGKHWCHRPQILLIITSLECGCCSVFDAILRNLTTAINSGLELDIRDTSAAWGLSLRPYLTFIHLSSCILSSGHIYDCIERNWLLTSIHMAGLSFMSNWWRNICNGKFIMNEFQMGLITVSQ